MFVFSSHAHAQGAIITWTGDSGYRTRISMTYDSLLTSVSATGSLLGVSDQGISSLIVSFYAPSSITPLYSITDISNSVPLYGWLNISFNTTSNSVVGSIDVGKDTFGEGLPGSSAGEYYLHGTITSPTLMDAGANLPLDTGGHFSVTIVPEPTTWSLCVIAAAAAIFFRLRMRPNTKDRLQNSVSIKIKDAKTVPLRPSRSLREKLIIQLCNRFSTSATASSIFTA